MRRKNHLAVFICFFIFLAGISGTLLCGSAKAAAALSETVVSSTGDTAYVGDSITITAEASGGTGTGYEYKFVVCDPDNNWTVLQAFSASNSYTYTPTEAGTYVFYVDYIDSSGAWATKNIKVTVGARPALSETVVSSTGGTAYVGNSITVAAEASGGTGKGYKYKFVVCDPDNNWTVLQAFSASNSYTYTPTEAGTYVFIVDYIDSSGAWATKYITVHVSVPALSETVVSSTGDTAYVGEGITITAEASGGTGTGYKYKFVVCDPDNNWTVLQAFSARNSYTYTPTEAGTYVFYVDYIDSSGAWATKYVTVNIPALTETLTSDPSGTGCVGQDITITAEASGGTGTGYEYKFVVCDPDNNWTVLQAFSSSNTYTYTPELFGTYVFYVDYMDSSGETFTKYVTVKCPVKYTDYSVSFDTYLSAEQANVSSVTRSDLDPSLILAADDAGKYEFMVLKWTDNGTITAAMLDNMITAGGTRSGGTLAGMGYAFLQAARETGVNPVYLVAHAILETGYGTSWLANGYDQNDTFVGYYNMFGIGAVDAAPGAGGIQYAKDHGWDTVEKAIIGGAEWISNQYINNTSYYSKATYNQDTLYKMKWDPDGYIKYGCVCYQYATDRLWAHSIAKIISEYSYILDGTSLSFDISQYN